jgi:MFS family permease
MGYAVGPLLGALLALYDLSSLFYAAGLISLLALFFVAKLWSALLVSSSDISDGAPRSFVDTLNVLHHDKKLVIFVISGVLAAVIHARWSAYLAQYLAVVLDAKTAYQTVAYIIATNAIAVVLLQYSLGSRVSASNIHKFISAGLFLFAVSLGIFALSNALWVWIFAILVFSVGEVLFTPASYLFVDRLAPDDMKGSYYGALNLTNLGGAVSPVVCGLLLSSSAPVSIFPFLITVAFLSFLYLRKANRQ